MVLKNYLEIYKSTDWAFWALSKIYKSETSKHGFKFHGGLTNNLHEDKNIQTKRSRVHDTGREF